ncbi:MAG TPA: EAL domain-containing protein [Nevskia sp.]|nr:EAL domain-containing protein [Nevskia sp.]
MSEAGNATDRAAQTILVVDDTPANLEVAVAYLEDHGFQMLVAQDGEEALDRVRVVQPDLILLDVMMPGINGFDTCRRLKSMEGVREVPVIFMTALTDVGDKVKAFAAGGVDYVTKPLQLEELLARVRTHLELHAARQRLAAQHLRLQSSEVRYRRLFEASKDGVLLVEFDSGRVTDVNAALAEMLSLPREEIVGQRLCELAALRNAPCKSALAELRLREQVRYEHWPLANAGGAALDVEFSANAYLVNGVKMVQCNIRDITERKQAESRIRYLALHDTLTGLPNRVLLHDRLNQAIAQARRNRRQVSVLMLDLDHFKHINDSLGHHVGDHLLEATAVRLRACLRESDIAARLGGDEFVIALPEAAEDADAALVAEKVLKTLREPFQVDGHELHVGVSIGISRYPSDGEDPGTLLRAADSAMYQAKNAGRGDFRFFTAAMSEAAQRRLELANDVRHAVQRGEFTLNYQPQVSARGGNVTGIEALLRWRHPRHGMISPEEFVPLLEEIGLIIEVGHWALRCACAQNAAWQRQGLPPMRVAVNLSAQQFYRGDIVGTVRGALADSGLAPEWLELELTESLTLDDTEMTIKLMHELKQLGVCLSLDDFGTGWSSLSYLRRFPLDRIKIDRSFMRDLVTQPTASAVVRSIMGLARNLGLTCVAEGVETADQLSYLQKQMCADIQGFLFSPAVSGAEIETMLRSTTPWGSKVIAAQAVMADAPVEEAA